MAAAPAGHQCYHCKQWVAKGEPHDCWTTTEVALTKDLSEDLQEAWARLRETAAEFGDQRIYASHHSIMFSRKVCYFFVRPKLKYLELCVFLPRVVTSPRVHRVYDSATDKRAHMMRVVHRDEVEAPLTDWLREAYDFAVPKVKPASAASGRRPRRPRKARATTVSRTEESTAGQPVEKAAKKKGTRKKVRR